MGPITRQRIGAILAILKDGENGTTIIINLLTAKGQDAQSTAILLSEKELCMPDIKSMQKKRTVSYISDNDETTLKSMSDA